MECIWFHTKSANLIVLLPDNDTATPVYTFFPFSPLHKCEHIVPVLLTTYSGPNSTSSLQLFPDKYDSLHGCPLRISTYSFPPMTIFRPEDKAVEPATYSDVGGIYGQIMRSLSHQMNYTHMFVDCGDHGDASATNKTSGCIALVTGRRANMTIGNYVPTSSRSHLISASVTLYTSAVVIALPPGAPYSPLHKLLMPFQTGLWLLLACGASATAIVVLLLDRCVPSWWRSLFLGEDRRPMLSTFAIALGCGISPLPRRNLARFMFLSWTVLLFVLRNSYLSYMCYFLQSEQLQSRPVTMAGLVADNCIIYVTRPMLSLFVNIPELAGAIVRVQSKKAQLNLTVTLPVITENIGVMTTRTQLAYHSRDALRTFGVTIAMPSESIVSIPVVIYMTRGCGLQPKLNEHINRLQSAGLIPYWFKQTAPTMMSSARTEGPLEPRTLLLEQLLGAFVLCAVILVLAVPVFVLEVLVYRFNRRGRNPKMLEIVTS